MKGKYAMQSKHANVIQAALVLGAVAAAGAAFSGDRSASPAPGPQSQPAPILAAASATPNNLFAAQIAGFLIGRDFFVRPFHAR